MAIFEWNKEYLLGVKEFDEHHEHLVGLLNKSFDEFEKNAPPEKLETIIDELIDYATYHFAAEEYWMAEYSYPKLAEHKDEHDKFSAKVVAFKKDLMAGKATLNVELFSFLADWLTTHILESDSDYGRFNASNPRT
jgi:hemerythrin